jgi:predicted metalloprotease
LDNHDFHKETARGKEMLDRLIIVVSLVALFAPSIDAAAAQNGDASGANSYTSPGFGYSLTWDETWELAENSSTGGYDVLHLTHEDSDLYLEGYVAYGGDTDVCIDDALDWLQSDTTISDYAVIGRQSPSTATPTLDVPVSTARVTYSSPDNDGTPTDYTESILCQTIKPGTAVLVITFISPTDEFDTLSAAADALLSNVSIPAPPPPIDVAAVLSNVEADLNTYWSEVFKASGMTYAPPTYINFDGPVKTACVDTEPFSIGPFYCPLDSTVYFDMPFMNQEVSPFGVFVIAFVTAHETGHHIENLIKIEKCLDPACTNGIPSFYYELLADCLAGSWAQNASDRGLIAPGEVESTIVALASYFGDKGSEAENTTGDPLTAHGPGSQRTWWFLKGYFEGIDGCLSMATGTPATPVAG